MLPLSDFPILNINYVALGDSFRLSRGVYAPGPGFSVESFIDLAERPILHPGADSWFTLEGL